MLFSPTCNFFFSLCFFYPNMTFIDYAKALEVVQDDPKLLNDGGEIPKSQGRGWGFVGQLWNLLSTWQKTYQVINRLMCFGASMSAFCLKNKKKPKKKEEEEEERNPREIRWIYMISITTMPVNIIPFFSIHITSKVQSLMKRVLNACRRHDYYILIFLFGFWRSKLLYW